jgi:hypothetical protein
MMVQKISRAFVIALVLLVAPTAALAQTTVAGFTPGSARVTESGAFSYSIPIRVPPGIAGLQPSMTLVYNSQGANGLLGIGWSLGGLTAIHRCGRTIIQDGLNAGVSYDGNDRYCLDGQRLVAVAGSYGAHDTEYRTERETFTKVISYGTCGNGPCWFHAWTKGGQRIEYGNTADSRIEAQGKSSVRVYAVNKISDTKGNYLTVSYAEDTANGDFYPTRIDYTGNASVPSAGSPTLPFASVRFSYQARTDNQPKYIGGSVIRSMNRLTNVKAYFGETAVTDYRLAYDYGGFGSTSRLLSITECSGDGSSCFPATSLTWQAASGNSGFTASGSWTAGEFARIADLNGDGLGDLIVASGSSIQVGYSTGSGWTGLTQIATDSSRCLAYLGGETGWQCVYTAAAFAVGDINGDGLADIVTGSGQVYLSTGGGFSTAQNWGSGAGDLGGIADLDGDGKGDLVFRSGTSIMVAYSNGSSFSVPVQIGSDSGACTVYVGIETGWQCVATAAGLAVGDVNGDGRADIVTGAGLVYLSAGSGFAAAQSWGVGVGDLGLIADVNADGLGDLVLRSGAYIQVAYSNGVSFGAPVTLAMDTSGCIVYADFGTGWQCSAAAAAFAVGDVNGDGLGDIAAGAAAYLATKPGPDAVTRITNSLGQTFDAAYTALSNGSIYVTESGSAWPVRDVRPQVPLHVAQSSSISNGIGGGATTSYVYRGARVHMHGGGFLGFREIEATDGPTGIKTTTTVRQDYPFQGLASTSTKTKSTGVTLSQVASTWSTSVFPNSTGWWHRADLAQTVETGNDLDSGAALPSITTSYGSYDGYGNVGQVTVTTSYAGKSYTKTTDNTYTNDTGNWFLGRLTSAQVTSVIPTEP